MSFFTGSDLRITKKYERLIKIRKARKNRSFIMKDRASHKPRVAKVRKKKQGFLPSKCCFVATLLFVYMNKGCLNLNSRIRSILIIFTVAYENF